MESQALIYTRSSGVRSSDSCRRDVFHASASETFSHFRREGLTRESSLMMIGYNMGGETPFRHSGRAIVMSRIQHVPRKEMLQREEGTPRAGKRVT